MKVHATPPVGTIGHGTCGTMTDNQGFQPPPGPWPTKGNGNCKIDPKGFYPHQLTFEACVALVKSNDCTMAQYVSWGGFNIPKSSGQVSSAPFESACMWFSECDFANLCEDPSKGTGQYNPLPRRYSINSRGRWWGAL